MLGIFILLVLVFFLILGITRLIKARGRVELPTFQKPQWEFANIYKRKTYLFDSNAEFNFFKILNELYGEKYYIFPQINLAHLIEPRTTEFYDRRSQRSRIEKKSVDFVLCDKVSVVPQLVIELDGYYHDRADRKIRDSFVNELMKDIGLPITRIKTGNMDRGYIKLEIEKALASK